MYTWEWYDWIFLGLSLLMLGGISFVIYMLYGYGKAVAEIERIYQEADLY